MMRGVIVGFGEVARHGHWPAYAGGDALRIVAVVDPSVERRASAAQTISGVRTFASIADVDLAVDFADICTPPATHQGLMGEALARGWHVLCEKPFVLQSAAIAAIRSQAQANALAVVPVHNWKYAPIVRRTSELLAAGAIGRVRHVEIVTTRTQAASTSAGGAYNWRHDPSVAGGGILMDHGWHGLYLALHWFGEPPTGISGQLGRRSPSGAESDADVRVAFPSGEARIVLTWNGTTRSNRVTLRGDAGDIVVDDDTLRVSGAAPGVERFAAALSAGSHHAEWFAAMLPDVIACFRAPAQAGALLDEAERCIVLIEEAYARSAAPVR